MPPEILPPSGDTIGMEAFLTGAGSTCQCTNLRMALRAPCPYNVPCWRMPVIPPLKPPRMDIRQTVIVTHIYQALTVCPALF